MRESEKDRELLERTRESFGFQWREFKEIDPGDDAHFLNYIAPVEPAFFRGKVGLDAACGFGRHLACAARFGAKMAVGLDFSDAILSARENTAGLPNCRVVRGDLYRVPFRPASFDFIYCIGALHHLPDPERAFQGLLNHLKPGAPVFIWVYSKSRRRLNALLEAVRGCTKRLPHRPLKALCALAACLDYGLFVLPYRLLRGLPLVERMTPARVKLYARFTFRTCFADWFDRLAAPIRYYYDRNDMEAWAGRAGLENVVISPTGLYGWRLYGEKPAAPAGNARPRGGESS